MNRAPQLRRTQGVRLAVAFDHQSLTAAIVQSSHCQRHSLRRAHALQSGRCVVFESATHALPLYPTHLRRPCSNLSLGHMALRMRDDLIEHGQLALARPN